MTDRLRLDKWLSNMGIGTRSEIKRAIKQGKVTVDGLAAKDGGMIVVPGRHRVAFEGTEVRYKPFIYVMLNKPPGVVSATEDTKETTVVDLLEDEYRLYEPFPAGRLDKDTVGLLLLTNDGKLAHELLSPRKHVNKTYEALVLGEVNGSDVAAFAAGVVLDDGYVTMPAELEVLETSTLEGGDCRSRIWLTIREGKFHQVKRMFRSVGKQVLSLKRLSMGTLRLDAALEEGQYRELTDEELAALKAW